MEGSSIQVASVSLDGQQVHAGRPFPLILACQGSTPTLDAVTQWLSDQRHDLLQRLQLHGTLLFRGFPLASPEDFDRFIAAFQLENFPYKRSLSNAVRVNYTPRVFSANEAPPEVTIFLHHEMAQTPFYPTKLLFFCQQPAAEGGATPLCRSDVLFEQIQQRHPHFARDCESLGLKYSNVMPDEDDVASGMGRSWRSTYGAETREQAEQRLRELGYTWEWLPNGCLRATTPVLPAVHEVSPGRKTFFNQLIAAFSGWKDSRNDPAKAISFGDGSRLDADAVLDIAELAEKLTFDVPWQAGDVALVDNLLVMHGRRTFAGKRRVLASLVDAQSHVLA